MRIGMARALAVTAASLWLVGCNAITTDNLSGLLVPKTNGTDTFASTKTDVEATSGAPPIDALASAEPGLLGNDTTDDLSTGKKYFRAGNFGMAERYFRRAVELHPRDAEAWLDLAAAYDRMRRFDLADRAYAEAIHIVGPTAEILNNQGYSYMLRGDYARARKTLLAAERKDPTNRFVRNNLQLLAASVSTGKAIE